MTGRRVGSRGALVTIAVLFLGSAVLRLWDSGMAIALEMTVDNDAANMAAAICEPTPDIDAAIAAIQAREGRIGEQELALADKARALEVAGATITQKLAELEAAEASLAATMTQSESAAEDDLARLTAVYENMKPKEAATLFAAMDPDFAAGFMGRMRADAAAQIMAGLDPATAYSISVILAGRNARAPTQ